MGNFLDFLNSKNQVNGKTTFGSLVSNITNYIKTGQLTSSRAMGTSDAYTDSTSEDRYIGRSNSLKPVTKRFLLGNEWGSQSNNAVFATGFDDPAHLTFKVEFGGWGYSTMDRTMIESVERNSTESGVYYTDFDQFPMGLLSLTREEDFTRIKTYSSYTYLANRNEDRRAQYIADFVDGIIALQQDFPYIFQSVSGLEKLTDFDSKRGQRLKDATITLQCIDEGIDLKIRTLMELYRKAAWDDEWQRWVLPDIYRYFKMIIYIFDDRALQMGNGQWSPDQDSFPCIALECGPCEFVIKSQNESSYTQNYSDVKNSTPTLEIKVQNIRTYFANQMFQRVKYVNDILTKFDHDRKEDNDDLGSLTGSGELSWKYNWMARNFLMPDEYYAFATQSDADGMPFNHYAGNWKGTTEVGTSDEEMFDLNMQAMYKEAFTPDNTWHRATVTDRQYIIDSWGSLWNSIKSIVTSNTTLIRDSRQPDRYYFVNDLTRLNPETFTYMVNKQMQNQMMIDISAVRLQTALYIEYMKGKMSHIKDTYSSDVLDVSASERLKKMMEPVSLDTSLPAKMDNFVDIEQNPYKPIEISEMSLVGGENPAQEYVQLVPTADIPEQEFTVLNVSPDIPVQEMTEMILNLDKPEQDYVKLIMNLDKPIQDFVQLNTEVEEIKMTMTNIIKNLDLPEQDFAELIMNLDLPKMDFAELIKKVEIAQQKFTELNKNTELPEQEFTQLIKNLEIPEMAFALLNMNLDKPQMDMTEIIKNLTKPIQEFTQLIDNRDIPVQDFVELIKNTDLPEQDMTQMIMNLDKAQHDFVEMIMSTEKAKQDFVKMIINDSKTSQDMVKLVETIFKPNQIKMVKLVDNYEPVSTPMVNVSKSESIPEQKLVNVIDNSDKVKNHVFVEEIKYTDKQEQVMVEQELNEDKQEQVMTEIVENEDKPKSPDFVKLVENEHEVKMQDVQLVEPVENTVAPMVEIIKNEHEVKMQDVQLAEPVETSDAPMVKLVENEYEVKIQDVRIIENEHDVKMQDVELSDKSSEPVMQDVKLEEPVKTSDVPMTKLVENEHNVKMQDVHLAEPVETSDAPMVKLVENEHDVKIQNVRLVETEESGEVPMTKLVENEHDVKIQDVQLAKPSKSEDAPMVELVKNEHEVKMQDVRLEELKTSSDAPMVQMVETDKNDVSISTRSIYKDIPDKEQSTQTIQGGKLIDYVSDDLKTKIMRLVSIDTDSIEKASFESMVKLVGIMEDTIKDAREQLQKVQLVEPEVKPKKNKLLTEVKLQTAPKNTFLSTKMRDIDDVALARAEYAQSQNSKKDNK